MLKLFTRWWEPSAYLEDMGFTQKIIGTILGAVAGPVISGLFSASGGGAAGRRIG